MAADTLSLAKDHKKQEATYATMRRGIRAKYAEGWGLFDAVIFAMQQNGLAMLRRLDTAEEDGHSEVREALMLIHANSTVTLYEIRTLLLEGLWAGGAARWRALHELTVTAKLVARGESPIARRYLKHGFVVQTERLSKYWDRHARGPLSAEDLEQRRKKSADLIGEFTLPDERGSFRDPYGWAAPLMDVDKIGKRQRPTFDRLEKLAELDDLRLLVNTSHGFAHGDSGGVFATVLMGSGAYALGPVNEFTATVARPTLLSAMNCVGSTHLGFENTSNEFAQLIGLLAASAMKLAARGAEAFID